MRVSAWSNGSGSYGLKIQKRDLEIFDRNWHTVTVNLFADREKIIAVCNIDKDSFWLNCRELISKDIKHWLEKKNFLTWEKGYPPIFEMKHIHENVFEIKNKTR